MSTRYTAAVHCDAQGSVKCHGLVTVVGADPADPRALADRVWDTVEGKGWRRMRVVGQSTSQTRDVCPACQAAIKERGPR